jgi:hypothetical protein
VNHIVGANKFCACKSPHTVAVQAKKRLKAFVPIEKLLPCVRTVVSSNGILISLSDAFAGSRDETRSRKVAPAHALT